MAVSPLDGAWIRSLMYLNFEQDKTEEAGFVEPYGICVISSATEQTPFVQAISGTSPYWQLLLYLQEFLLAF